MNAEEKADLSNPVFTGEEALGLKKPAADWEMKQTDTNAALRSASADIVSAVMLRLAVVRVIIGVIYLLTDFRLLLGRPFIGQVARRAVNGLYGMGISLMQKAPRLAATTALFAASLAAGFAHAQDAPNILTPTPAPPAVNTLLQPGQSPLSGQNGQLDITYPDRIRVILNEGAPLVIQDGALRVKARFTDLVGPQNIRDMMREVEVRGTLQILQVPQSEAAANTRRGVITWTSVRRPDNSAIAVLATPLGSQFETGLEELPQGQEINAAGDTKAVTEAVALLYGIALPSEDNEIPGAPPQGAQAQSEPSGVAGPAGQSEGGVQQQAGLESGLEGGGRGAAHTSGGSGKEDKTEFKLPERVETREKEEPVLGTTREGCPPEIDIANNTVKLRAQVTENGSSTGSCSPDGTQFTLQNSYSGCGEHINPTALKAHPKYKRYWVQDGETKFADTECQIDTEKAFEFKKSYAGCTDDVSRTANFAYPRFKYYYVNTAGQSRDVSAVCERDEENKMGLTEDRTRCSWNADISTMKATPMAELIYTNRNGDRVVVDSCSITAEMEALQVDITGSTEGCQFRNDFAVKKSFETAKAVFLADGVQLIAHDCTETGREFTHQIDTASCDAQIDRAAGQAIPRGQVYIQTGGSGSKPVYLTTCRALPNNAVALTKETTGCENVFVHDTGSNKSYGATRLYHTLAADKSKTYVSPCEQDDAIEYDHQFEIVSYRHNDTTRESTPLVRIYINAHGRQVEVGGAQARAGYLVQPYTFKNESIRLSGKLTYKGCDRYEERNTYDVYDRADQTEYMEFKVAAKALGPLNACKSEEMPWVLVENSSKTSAALCNYTVRKPMGRQWETRTVNVTNRFNVMTKAYQSTRKVVREDGDVQATETAERRVTCSISHRAGQCGGSLGNMCQQNANPRFAADIVRWRQELNWQDLVVSPQNGN